jgi:hypothetical protein
MKLNPFFILAITALQLTGCQPQQAAAKPEPSPTSQTRTAETARPDEPLPSAVPLFDGRVLDGAATMPGPSLADIPLIEDEVRARAREPFLQGTVGQIDSAPSAENFAISVGVPGWFTRTGRVEPAGTEPPQKAFLYRYSLTNGIVIVEDGRVVAHYSGGPGDYAFYFYLKTADLNGDGRDDLILKRNVEDNENVYAYLFEMSASGPTFVGSASVYTSNVEGGGDVSRDKASAVAYNCTVVPGPKPVFSQEVYTRAGAGEWILSQPAMPFELENRFQKGDEPTFKDITPREGGADIEVSNDKIQQAIAKLSSYADVPSSIDCDSPRSDAERMVCGDPQLRLMETLDTRAAVYAFENASKQEVDHQDSARFSLAGSLSDLKSAEAIRAAYIEHTNESLGGESPYSR